MNNLDYLDPSLIVVGVLVILAVFLVPFIFYLITLQNTIKKIEPRNRTIEPGQVWFMFIPLFNVVWQFIMVTKIADSLYLEFKSRGIAVKEQYPGKTLGIVMGVLNLLGAIPVIGGIFTLGWLVCWIAYWVKMHGYKKLMEEGIESNILDASI